MYTEECLVLNIVSDNQVKVFSATEGEMIVSASIEFVEALNELEEQVFATVDINSATIVEN